MYSLYLIFYSFLIIFTHFNFTENNKNLKELISLYFIVIGSLFILIHQQLPDRTEYYEIYNQVPKVFSFFKNISYISRIHGEFLFKFAISVVKVIIRKEPVGYFIFAIFFIALRYRVYKKYTNYALLALFLFFTHEYFLKDTIQLRNGYASVIVLFSIKYVHQRNFIKFIITVLIAAGFHSIALVVLPIYFLVKINRKYLFLILFLCILISQLRYLHSLINHFGNLEIVPSIVVNYINVERYSKRIPLYYPTIVKQIIISLVGVIFYNKLTKYPYFKTLFYYYYLSTVYYILFSEIGILAGRIAGILYSIEPVLLTYYVAIFKDKRIYYCIFMCYSILFIFYHLVLQKEFWTI